MLKYFAAVVLKHAYEEETVIPSRSTLTISSCYLNLTYFMHNILLLTN